jgi:hypothetical protein
VKDHAIQQELLCYLHKVRSAETVFDRLNAPDTLRCPMTPVKISGDKASTLTSEEIYERCWQSIVVIGMLQPDGMMSQSTGSVLNPAGVIETNFHMVNRPNTVAARGTDIRSSFLGNQGTPGQ